MVKKTSDQLSHARQMLRNFLASGHHRLRHLLCDKRLKKHFILKPKGRGQEASFFSDDAKVRINSAKRSRSGCSVKIDSTNIFFSNCSSLMNLQHDEKCSWYVFVKKVHSVVFKNVEMVIIIRAHSEFL